MTSSHLELFSNVSIGNLSQVTLNIPQRAFNTSLLALDPFKTSLLPLNPDSSRTYVVTRRLQTVLLPFICLLGLFGNVLAVKVFLSPTMRRTSCCLYLASKTISDIGFLLSLLVMWLYQVRVPVLDAPGVCQTTVFVSYVCGFLSVWFVVAITFENFIRIRKPWMIPELCSYRKAVLVIVAMVVFTCGLYSFTLWSTGIVPDRSPKCQSLDKYRGVVVAMTSVHTFLTLILPSIAMVILVMSIMFSALQAYKRKLRLRLLAHAMKGKSNSTTPEGKVIRFLFAVSVIFLLLHTPSHVVRMRLVIMSYILHEMPSISDLIVQRLFEIFLYLNFSVNCLVYLVFGENFRRIFRQMYFDRCQPSNTCAFSKV